MVLCRLRDMMDYAASRIKIQPPPGVVRLVERREHADGGNQHECEREPEQGLG